MKRLLSVLLCMLMLASVCLSVSAAPADSVTFTLDANDAKVGETVTVTVSITEKSYYTNATIYLHYDASAMEYVSDELGAAAPKSAMYLSNNFVDQGYVKLAYVAINGLQKGGELYVFTFKVLSDKAAEFSMSFDECIGADDDNNEFDLNYTVVPCTVNGDSGVDSNTTTTKKEPTTTTTTVDSSVTTTTTAVSSEDDVTTTTEPVQDNETTTSKDGTTTTAKTTAGKTTTKTTALAEDTPKTGESSDAMMMLIVAIAAAAVVGISLVSKKIKN